MTHAHHKLQTALGNVAHPPCTRNGLCRHYSRCASEVLACEAFRIYVKGGGNQGRRPNIIPSRVEYERVFDERDEDEADAEAA